MVRRILLVFLLLLVAMAINLTVAWGAVWLFAHSDAARQPIWVSNPHPAIPSDEVRGFWEEEFGPSVFVTALSERRGVATAPSTPDLGSSIFLLQEIRRDSLGCTLVVISDEYRQAPVSMEVLLAGWPLRALRCERVFRPKQYEVKHAWMAFANNGTRAGGMILPCKPMWTGAIVNTLFYAMSLLLVSFGVTSGRRAIRRRGKRCVACGYDLRAATSDVCPECGTRSAPSRLDAPSP